MKKIIIAIDGPASSGKSTTAKLLAQKLGYVYIDTGAMYRACALMAYRNEIAIGDTSCIEDLLQDIVIEIRYTPNGNLVLLNGEDVSEEIRKEHISTLASDISALEAVRNRMVELQRFMAREGGVVMDGRDIGTVVFPQAQLKFYMTAKAEIRAKRRWLELVEKGYDADFDDVLQELNRRDYNDCNREIAPLRAANDAICIDTGELSIDAQVKMLYDKVMEYLRKP